jgi:hypothetical protein
MSGSVVVDADPLPRFSAADRAARQAILMEIYDWTHGLGEARVAARALMGQRDSLRSDLGANADSLNARIARLSGEIDRAFNAVKRAASTNRSVERATQRRSTGVAVVRSGGCAESTCGAHQAGGC